MCYELSEKYIDTFSTDMLKIIYCKRGCDLGGYMVKKFSDQIDQLKKNFEAVSGTQSIPFSELFNNQFLAECSSFTSLKDMFNKSGFSVETKEDFAAIPDQAWEDFITQNTSYSSWKEMQVDAGRKHIKKMLNKGM